VNFALALATRAVFFENGKAIADGSVGEIIRRFDWNMSYSALPEVHRRA
jgi:hypothetical protein